ncbi:DNA polymerase/3'-5' exonuclease PolX [Candidatus Bathyarchaeota archaeon]|nr:DNA polymerase/3'-5' exonuclease PolX [Candidatus Bathyarchaeota archaeon]
MTSKNEIARILHEIADLLELQDVAFKPRAYRAAARQVRTTSKGTDELDSLEVLTAMDGIGESIGKKILEIIETGSLDYLESLRKKVPGTMVELVKLNGVGPKTAIKLRRELGITSIDQLENAARDGKLRDLDGLGKKTEQNIIDAIDFFRAHQGRSITGHVMDVVTKLKENFSSIEGVDDVVIAGSYRRGRATVGDLDYVILSSNPAIVNESVINLNIVSKVRAAGKKKTSIIIEQGLQVDIRYFTLESYGAALLYFTGSKNHNVKLRKVAIDKGLKLNEFGLHDGETQERIAGRTEKEVYGALGMEWITPEIREDRGEVEAAMEGRLPELVTRENIKGMFHVHTSWSEGNDTIQEMAVACRDAGYEYVAICDHAGSLGIAGGLMDDEIRDQINKIHDVDTKLDGITLLTGIEANIDSEGHLDVQQEILDDLDVVVASIHTGFNQSREKITERILTAMANDAVTIIGHPTGRLLTKRDSYDIDLDKVFERAAGLGTWMELNAYPTRLDLSGSNCMKAKRAGCTIAIGSDAHDIAHLRYMTLGIKTARRGWLEPGNVANTKGVDELSL